MEIQETRKNYFIIYCMCGHEFYHPIFGNKLLRCVNCGCRYELIKTEIGYDLIEVKKRFVNITANVADHEK